MSPPLWLLDVDGVLNAATSSPDRSVWDDWQRGEAVAAGRVWPIWFSPTVCRRIGHLHEEGSVDVRWLTTWEDDANAGLRELLGLPRLPVAGRAREVHAGNPGPHGFVGRTPPRPAPGWWKLTVARRVADPDPMRPLVWTDDDLRYEQEALAWAEDRPGPRLLVAPQTHVGLTPPQLDAIEEFCRQPRLGAQQQPPRAGR